MPTQRLCLTVSLLVRAGAEESALECLRQLEAASVREPGCLAYVPLRSTGEPRRFFIYELYRDADALEAHRRSAHFVRYAEGELYALVEERQAEFYAPIAAAPNER